MAVARRKQDDGRGARTLLLGAAALTLVAVVGAVVRSGEAVVAEPGDVRVTSAQVRFQPDRLAASAGRVGVFVENEDLFWHTFTIAELDVDLRVPVGAERRLTFDAAPGSYRFICAIPGHEQAGMDGTLNVR
jgi:uncharacterized cupredoxin-like copper-binding protein